MCPVPSWGRHVIVVPGHWWPVIVVTVISVNKKGKQAVTYSYNLILF